MTRQLITEVMFLPDGLDPDSGDAHSYGVFVSWRGKDTYAVTHGRAERRSGTFLSRAGNWKHYPLPMQRRQYRFTYDEAMEWAARVVNDVTVYGQTWAQWSARWAAKPE